MLPVLFEGPDRQRAIAAIGGATMLSFPIGPIVGGYLLDHFWWGSVFLINVPIVVLALVAVALLLPESRSAARPSVDLAGLVVSSAGLVALTYGFIKAGQDGWSDGAALGLIVAGGAILALLPLVERSVARRGGHPLADLRLFASPDFRWGTIMATLMSFAMFGMFFALPQYFQEVRGADSLGSGLRLLPMVGGMLVGMVGGTRLAGGAGSRPGGRAAPLITAGFLLMAVAMVLGAFTTLGSSTGYTLAWVAVSGLGLGLVMPASMGVALGALSAERSGAGIGAAHRDAPGRLHDRRRHPRHRDQQQLQQRGGGRGGRPARAGRGGGPVQRRGRRRSGRPARQLVAAARRTRRVRERDGHHAVDLRRHRGRLRPARAAGLPLARPRRHHRRGTAATVPRPARAGRGLRFASGRLGGRIKSVTDMIAGGSLRERKKARTRASLREHALRLFREQGYQATTVEQIAAAAEVSPSTFFRYFPTKEDLVLQDDMDVRMVAAFTRQPPGLSPVAAIRAAVGEAWESFTPQEWAEIREGARLSLAVPEIRARAMNEFARTINAIAGALAARVGRPPDDVRVRVLAGAVVGVLMSVFLPPQLEAATEEEAEAMTDAWLGPDSVARIDEALSLLESGLPL